MAGRFRRTFFEDLIICMYECMQKFVICSGLGHQTGRCRHTSGRSSLTAWGNTQYNFVEEGNTLACRTILLILVCQWRRLRWLMEQPDGSFFPLLPRFQWLLSVIQALDISAVSSRFDGFENAHCCGKVSKNKNGVNNGVVFERVLLQSSRSSHSES